MEVAICEIPEFTISAELNASFRNPDLIPCCWSMENLCCECGCNVLAAVLGRGFGEVELVPLAVEVFVLADIK
jgi:hypothetical protein